MKHSIRRIALVVSSGLVFLAVTAGIFLAKETTQAISTLVPGERAFRQSVALTASSGSEEPGREASNRLISRKADPEREAWLEVAAARLTGDHRHYRRALEIAIELEATDDTRYRGMLLQGHVLHQRHRFAEAKKFAHRLANERGRHWDFGLLGDVLFDLGDVDQAVEAYERQMSLRPGLEAYARAGQVRWLKGKTESAIRAMEMAAAAGSPRHPEPLAWVLSTLARYQFQSGLAEEARRSLEKALQLVPGHGRALVARAGFLMAEERFSEAAGVLSAAAARAPDAALLWMLADCHNALGQSEHAGRLAQGVVNKGAAEDPRTLSLYLATTGGDANRALALATKELELRQDIYTHDAVAWAALAAGETTLAQEHMRLALAEGTKDARLYLHAASIALAADDFADAAHHHESARMLRHMLLPSEIRHLERSSPH